MAHHAPTEPAPGPPADDLGRLFDATYDELRRVARRCFAGERQGVTLQPTAVVHEAYLRLSRHPEAHWHDRVSFLTFAARIMRQVLVDEARHRQAQKRGGGARITLVDGMGAESSRCLDVLVLHDALTRLEAIDERKGQIVLLRYFSAMGIAEVAEALGVSVATVNREWRGARAWLGRELGE
ncbi:MAG: ECF-type sigma factor [Acidobacteriota bacterium]